MREAISPIESGPLPDDSNWIVSNQHAMSEAISPIESGPLPDDSNWIVKRNGAAPGGGGVPGGTGEGGKQAMSARADEAGWMDLMASGRGFCSTASRRRWRDWVSRRQRQETGRRAVISAGAARADGWRGPTGRGVALSSVLCRAA